MFNWDQTGISVVPGSSTYMYVAEVKRRVKIGGSAVEEVRQAHTHLRAYVKVT